MAAIGAECARFWYNMKRNMSVRMRKNRLGRGVWHGRDGEGALCRSRDTMQWNLSILGCVTYSMGSDPLGVPLTK